MPRRTQSRVKSAGRTRFWIGYSGVVNALGVAAGAVAGAVLLDPRNYEPGTIGSGYSEDVSGDGLTVHRIRLDTITTGFPVIVGTAQIADLYFGVVHAPTTSAGQNTATPSLGNATSIQADWMDLWVDSMFINDPLLQNRSGGSFPKHNSRDIKTKRKLAARFDDGILFNIAYFPHTGTFANASFTTQFLVRMLCSQS